MTRAVPATAQDTAKPKGPTLPLVPTRPLKFSTSEGTWMSVDVSSDGRTIVFDLLGDLYTLPIGGGNATRITSGSAFDAAPRYSPDGKQIVFVSDRDGSDNVWIANADGSSPRQLTRTQWFGYISPEWTPDGQYIVVGRNASDRYYGPFDLYLFNKDGGSGQKITEGGNSYLGAAFSSDPRYLFVAQGRLAYGGLQIAILDRVTGRTTSRTSELAGAFRPAVSPDGKKLVFAARHDGKTGFKIRDLETSQERWLAPDVQHDNIENFAPERDALPGSSFTPDGGAFVTSYGGKLWKIEVSSGKATAIPFTADVDQMMGPLVKYDYPLNDSTLAVRQIRWGRPSPNGRQLAFAALDKVWVMDLPSGTPHRVSKLEGSEGYPAWAPDGKHLSFAHWTEKGGTVYRAAPSGQGQPEKLTQTSAFYSKLAYTPDGSRLVMVRTPNRLRLEGSGFGNAETELVWIPATGGAVHAIGPLSGYVQNEGYAVPHFGPDSTQILIYDQGEGLVSFRFDGAERRVILKATLASPIGSPEQADDIILSPKGDRAIALAGQNVYLVTVPPVGKTISLDLRSPAGAPVPARQITRQGGDYLAWQPDGQSFGYSLGRSYFRYDLEAADRAVADSTAAPPDTTKRGQAYQPARVDVSVTVPKDRPQGTVLLRGAQIITMKGNQVIPKGDILIRDNRIVAVGKAGSVQMPPGTTFLDVSGKTIIPGYVDIHAHLHQAFGLHRTQSWEYLANLAYGVTTTRDPQTQTSDVFDYSDRVETGDIMGPRIFATGRGIFVEDNLISLDAARDVLTRYADYYHSETIKQYLVGDRKHRQWALMAAAEHHLTPTTESGLQEKITLTYLLDGYPGLEHNFSILPLYKDVVQLQAKSGATYTPTFVVAYGGPSGQPYWVQHHDLHADAKIARFWPHAVLDRVALRGGAWVRDSEYIFPRVAQQVAKFVAAGGKVGLGSHGNLQGIGAHFELWSYALGGVKPHEILRIATINGADAIGHAKDLGSIEVGKLADLQVLAKNPLTSIRNTTSLVYVIKNGRVYDANTLDQIWPARRKLDDQWWMEPAPAAPTQH